MKRPFPVFAVLLAAAACGGRNNVVVRASLDEAGSQPISDLPVRLVPYDQQAILDSLAQADSTPQPRLPSDALQRLRSLAAEEAQVKAKGDTAGVSRVQVQRKAYLAQLDSVAAARQAWLKDEQSDFDDAVKDWNSKGLAEKTDTTDARGHAVYKAAPGKWWAVARYVLPDAVMEWSIPVTASKKDSVVVRLTPANAKVQPLLQ